MHYSETSESPVLYLQKRLYEKLKFDPTTRVAQSFNDRTQIISLIIFLIGAKLTLLEAQAVAWAPNPPIMQIA